MIKASPYNALHAPYMLCSYLPDTFLNLPLKILLFAHIAAAAMTSFEYAMNTCVKTFVFAIPSACYALTAHIPVGLICSFLLGLCLNAILLERSSLHILFKISLLLSY